MCMAAGCGVSESAGHVRMPLMQCGLHEWLAGAILPVDGGMTLTSWLNTDVQPEITARDGLGDSEQ